MKSRYHLAEHREEYTASGLCSSASLRGAVSSINGLTGDGHLLEKGTRRARLKRKRAASAQRQRVDEKTET